MSAIRERLIRKLAKEIPFLNEGSASPIAWDTAEFILPTGHYRTSPYADVYRWEVYVKLVGHRYGHWVGCWHTMTEAASKKTKLKLSKFHHVIEIDVLPITKPQDPA